MLDFNENERLSKKSKNFEKNAYKQNFQNGEGGISITTSKEEWKVKV